MAGMERVERHASFGGWQEVWRHDAESAGLRHELRRVPAAAGRRGTVPGAVLAVGADLHRAERHHQGRRPAARGRARPDRDRARHQPARRGRAPTTTPTTWARAPASTSTPRRRRGRATTACTTTWRANCRRWSTRHFPVSDGARHLRPLDGRARRAGDRAAQSRPATAACRRSRRSSRPRRVPWGEKAFTAYLGEDREAWKAWDACELVAGAAERLPLRIEQGGDDPFLAEQLRPELLEQACAAAGHPCRVHCAPATTTATTSSPASWASMSRTTPPR